MDDMTLLREYARHHSEAAFEAPVLRHLAFVYSAAMRQVRDAQLAEEVAQTEFTILALKAGELSDRTVLTGWLFKATRLAGLAQIRAAVQRRHREQDIQMQTEIEAAAADPLWEQMSPLLDEALATLGEKDRQAVLLRFFENKGLADVGISLGTGEDTARKRVSRALEKSFRLHVVARPQQPALVFQRRVLAPEVEVGTFEPRNFRRGQKMPAIGRGRGEHF
jgi:RNA polymerase sigma factor (sigma-70 family)